jgi:hypothetical protein
LTKVGDRVRCPECGEKARVVWVSKEGRVMAVKCPKHHGQVSPPDKRFRERQTKRRGMVFLVAIQRGGCIET